LKRLRRNLSQGDAARRVVCVVYVSRYPRRRQPARAERHLRLLRQAGRDRLAQCITTVDVHCCGDPSLSLYLTGDAALDAGLCHRRQDDEAIEFFSGQVVGILAFLWGGGGVRRHA
jgi:hypothetical protein